MERQLTVYQKALNSIPAEALEDIIHDLIMTSKTFPIPQDFVDRWQAWKRIHREKIVDEFPEEDCDTCRGLGYIGVYYGGGKDYQKDLSCGYCQNWRRHWPAKKRINGKWMRHITWTLEGIEARGWELVGEVKGAQEKG